MKKKLFFFIFIFLISSISALDENLVVPCGGDSQLVMGCLGDEDLHFIGDIQETSGAGNPSQEEVIAETKNIFDALSFSLDGYKIEGLWVFIGICFLIILFLFILIQEEVRRKKRRRNI
jgi:hypothetical protein